MKLRSIYIVLFCGVICLHSCKRATNYDKAVAWYEDTKEEITDQADQTADSVFESIDLNANQKEKRSYKDGAIIKYETSDNKGTKLYTALYAKDTNFAFIKEFCTHGYLIYEGIEYKRLPYGLSTWYNCENGKILEQGIRHKFKKAGVWKKYNKDGTLKGETTHKEKIRPKLLPKLAD